jgi:N-acetylmuramoyl-L-alanine amidase
LRSREPGETSASTIFTELVREAARKRVDEPAPDAEILPTPDTAQQIFERGVPVEEVPFEDTAPELIRPANAPRPPSMAVKSYPGPTALFQNATNKTGPMTEADAEQAAALEAERIRRVKKRQVTRNTRRASALGGVFRAVFVMIISAGVMATILSWFTDPGALTREARLGLGVALYADRPTATPTLAPTPNWARTIGIVSGHRGPGQVAAYDPGAVCADDLRENDINFGVASKIVVALRDRGYRVELLDEFDPRLNDFQAAALVSIHSNDCRDYGEAVSGFLVSKAAAKPGGGPDDRLAECIAERYNQMTGLERRFGLTVDMTDYHSFREIHPLTAAAIIELGFMRADREKLTMEQDTLARGVVEGILCFLEPVDPFGFDPIATPVPSPEA